MRFLFAAAVTCVAAAATFLVTHAGAAAIQHRVAARHVARSTPTPVAKQPTATRSRQTSVAAITIKPAASVGTLEIIAQTLNNCVPASVAEVLAYWHTYRTQEQVQTVIRADGWESGTSPYGIPPYVRTLGLRAFIGTGGNEGVVKALISNGFPVLVEQWVSANNQVYHYRPVEAYDDASGQFVTSDPYLGAGHAISYSEFNAIWTATDGRFMVIYPPSSQSRLQAVLHGAGWNARTAYTQDLAWQQAQQQTAAAHSAGTWLWYNAWVGAAWDQAELGHFRLAGSALAVASQMGNSSTVIGWVQQDIKLLQQSG